MELPSERDKPSHYTVPGCSVLHDITGPPYTGPGTTGPGIVQWLASSSYIYNTALGRDGNIVKRTKDPGTV